MKQLDLELIYDLAEGPAEAKPFRPIHYLGSKLRMTRVIHETVRQVRAGQGVVCDLFSGSGVVSSALSSQWEVVAVDIQEYARVLAEAILNPVVISSSQISHMVRDASCDAVGRSLSFAFAPLADFEKDSLQEAARGNPVPLAELLEAGSILKAQIEGLEAVTSPVQHVFSETLRRLSSEGLDHSTKSVTARHFGALYFGVEQAVQLDLLRERIERAPPPHRDVLKAALLFAASKIVATVGKQFAQPPRPRNSSGKIKPNLWRRLAKDRALDVFSAFVSGLEQFARRSTAFVPGTAVRSDYQDFLRSWDRPVAAFYADPPYTRDHYSRYYHVLETLCLRDNPEVSKTNLDGGISTSRGVYRTNRHQSPFSIISTAPEAFEDLFYLTKSHNAPLILSYSGEAEGKPSRPRVMPLGRLVNLASEHFRTVEVRHVDGLKHSKLTKRNLHLAAPEVAESMLICLP